MYPIVPPPRAPRPGWPLLLGAAVCWLLGLCSAALAGADSPESMNIFAGVLMWLVLLGGVGALLVVLAVRQVRRRARWTAVATLAGLAVALATQVLALVVELRPVYSG